MGDYVGAEMDIRRQREAQPDEGDIVGFDKDDAHRYVPKRQNHIDDVKAKAEVLGGTFGKPGA
eukprot:2902397-Prymnesium_polylepis.1